MRVAMIGVVYIAEEQLKRGLYIFVFCLSLGIATAEVPELLSLSDDTTNDVQYLEYLSNRVHQLSPRPTPRRFESLDGRFSPVEDVESFTFESFTLHHLATKCPTKAAQDLLHLLSIQRKYIFSSPHTFVLHLRRGVS